MKEVFVKNRAGNDLGSVNLSTNANTDDLKAAFQKLYPKYYPSRQWFTFDEDDDSDFPTKMSRIPLSDGLLSEFGVRHCSTVTFKDLGPQISWKIVFLVEYFGPFLAHAIPYFYPEYVYGHPVIHTYVQRVAFYLVTIHYLKRELETIFVHRFSNATMPLFNIFKNSFHYWVLGGIAISYFIYHPKHTSLFSGEYAVNTLAILFLFCELGNLHAHITLKNLRPPGSKKRGVPRGGLFDYVTCANYTFEITAWFIFAIMTCSLTCWIFLFASTFQIYKWSLKKHKRLYEEFGSAKVKLPAKALIPFIV